MRQKLIEFYAPNQHCTTFSDVCSAQNINICSIDTDNEFFTKAKSQKIFETVYGLKPDSDGNGDSNNDGGAAGKR